MTRSIPSPPPPYDEERLDSLYDPEKRPSRSSLRSWRIARPSLRRTLVNLLLVALLVYTLQPLITLLRRNRELFQTQSVLSSNAPSSSAYTKTTTTSTHTSTSSLVETWSQSSNGRIPRILHQTTANSTIPAKWVDSQASCKAAYSDFEYMLWTDASAREFLSTNYPWAIPIWDNYAFPIQRADAIRYFVLYHFGGIYLDMDTWCNATIPLDLVEASTGTIETHHRAVFKPTLPTGVTNDIMIATARHPAYEEALRQLPKFFRLTNPWAKWMPYCAIMMSSGPLFLSLAVMNYLLRLPSLPSPTVQVIVESELFPYISDLESSTWHKADAKTLMWLGERPWTWFTLGAIGLLLGLWFANYVLVGVGRRLIRKISVVAHKVKQAKLA